MVKAVGKTQGLIVANEELSKFRKEDASKELSKIGKGLSVSELLRILVSIGAVVVYLAQLQPIIHRLDDRSKENKTAIQICFDKFAELKDTVSDLSSNQRELRWRMAQREKCSCE